MISEPDTSPERRDSLEHGLEISRADLDPVERSIRVNGNPVAVVQLSEALDPVAVTNFAGNELADLL